MKRFRLPLLVAGALAVLAALALAVVSSSSFQTWAVRRALAEQPDWRASVGAVSAGWRQVVLEDLTIEQAGAVLTVPRVEVELPVVRAGWSRQFQIARLVAREWRLDLSRAQEPALPVPSVPVAGSVAPPGPASPGGGPLAAATRVFAGIFGRIELPADVALEGVDLAGKVILPASRGHVDLTLTGGGLAANREGRFDLVARAGLTDPAVSTVNVSGQVIAAMDTARTFTRVAARLDATARGTRFPESVRLRADASAMREGSGETYRAAVVSEGRELLDIQAGFPAGAPKLTGTWKLDVREADVAPFSLGHPLPLFTLAGAGNFGADATLAALHVAGRIDGVVDRLQVVRPELAALGELKVTASFDVAEQDGLVGVQALEVALRGAQPVATLRILQAFAYTPATGELRADDTARELIDISLQGVPIDWIRPLVPDWQVSGGHLRGELAATARDGGLTLRSTSALTMDGIRVAPAGTDLVRDLDLAGQATAGYTPQGWQAEISDLVVRSGSAPLMTLDLRVGQLAGRGQAVKAAGRVNVSLPVLLAQPAAAGVVALARGEAQADFVLSLDGKKELQATLALRDLAATAGAGTVELPAVTTQIRADLSPEGALTFQVPVVIERGQRRSDVAVAGTLAPLKEKSRALDAEVSSTELFVEDARLLAALLPEKAPADPTSVGAPPWSGLHGAVSLQLKHVVYSDAFQVQNVTGKLRLEAGMLRLEGAQASVGESGRASASGRVTFDAAAPQPYALEADVGVREFDPGPLLRALSGAENATVEGKFDFNSRLSGEAASLTQLVDRADGELQVTSKGGVFRGLPVSVSNITETTSKWAAWLATAGSALSVVTGRKDFSEVANKAEAVTELARALNPILYDQLSVVISRDADLTTHLRDFTLISPELRLVGSGTARPTAGKSVLGEPLTMEFTLRARGRQGELLKYLGALEPQADDLGYSACAVPLKIGGTLGQPDTSELNGKLSQLAIEKSGFGDRAAEFFSWIRGGK